MLPPTHEEVIIIHLIYVPSRRKNLMMTREKSKPSGCVAQAHSWYTETYFAEKANLPIETRIKYREWRILTGDRSLLNIKGHQYSQCYVVLGVETSYWYFFGTEPASRNLEGSGVLRFSYCGCCIYRQFRMIITKIKTFTEISS